MANDLFHEAESHGKENSAGFFYKTSVLQVLGILSILVCWDCYNVIH